jgi:hypothetical protein
MQPSAKVIAFPARAGWDAARAAQMLDGVQAIEPTRVPTLKLCLLCLLAPVIIIGSLLTFLAVVGVFLIWFVIVSLLLVCMIIFARRFLRRRINPPISGFRHRTVG